MAVIAGNVALASDYNTLRGEVNRWFADNYTTVAFGDANQTYGWGGAAAATVTSGSGMTAAQMNELIDRCNIGQDISNTVSGALTRITAATGITAATFNGIETKSDSLTSGRLVMESAEMSVSGGGNSARTTTYSSAVTATYRYTFADFRRARYFWNSGGAITFYGSISGYSSGTGWDGAGINQIFTNMGTVTMDYTNCSYTGSGGTTTSIGFYDLTTSYQTIHTQAGTGVYSNATLVLAARRSTTGNYVELRVTITPESGRSVNGTTTCYSNMRKLIDQTSGSEALSIVSPTYSLVDGL